MRHADKPLFEALRAWRAEVAAENGLPPYVILHDKTLKDVCRVRPERSSQLNEVSGIGAAKLERYGKDLLRIVAEHPLDPMLDNALNDTSNQTLELWRQGIDIEAIIEQRGLTRQTVYSHLANAIAEGVLELQQVVSLDPAQIDEITQAFEFAEDENPRLRSIFDVLEGKYPFEVLTCVRASLGTTA